MPEFSNWDIQSIISGRVRVGKGNREGEEEREREQAKEEADTSERNPRWVGPLPPVLMSHGVENGVPLRGLDEGSKILIEALSLAAVLLLDFAFEIQRHPNMR